MKLLSGSFVMAVVLSATGQGFAQAPHPVVTDMQVTSLTDTSVIMTFTSGVAAFAGVDYKPANGGSWHTVNEAYAVKHSVALKGLNPGTRYTYIAWASGAPKMPPATFTTTSLSAPPVISSAQLVSAGKKKLAETPGNTRLILLIGLAILAVLGSVLAIREFFRRRSRQNENQPVSDSWRLRPNSGHGMFSPIGRILKAEKTKKREEEDVLEETNSYLTSGRRTAFEVDDDLVRMAQEYTGLTNETALIEEALKALIRKEASRRLASLPGTEPELDDIWRHRTP